MAQKKLQKGSIYEQADLDGDGEVSDRELSLHKELVQLENLDKMQDQHRAMAWVAMGSVCIAVGVLFTPLRMFRLFTEMFFLEMCRLSWVC